MWVGLVPQPARTTRTNAHLPRNGAQQAAAGSGRAGPRVHDQTDVDKWASLVDAAATCSPPFLPALPHPLRALCPARSLPSALPSRPLLRMLTLRGSRTERPRRADGSAPMASGLYPRSANRGPKRAPFLRQQIAAPCMHARVIRPSHSRSRPSGAPDGRVPDEPHRDPLRAGHRVGPPRNVWLRNARCRAAALPAPLPAPLRAPGSSPDAEDSARPLG